MPEPVIRDVPRIFIAHACKFDWYVHPVAAWLKLNGVRAYLAEEHHLDGVGIEEKTFPEIDSSDGMILAWTRSAAESSRVPKEYARAIEKGLPVQLWLPTVGVDRPAQWGDKEFVHVEIREWTIGPLRGKLFVNMDEDRRIRQRALEFAFRCLREANAKSSKSVST